jgi:hypothetical protein
LHWILSHRTKYLVLTNMPAYTGLIPVDHREFIRGDLPPLLTGPRVNQVLAEGTGYYS